MSDWVNLDSRWILDSLDNPTAIERPEMLAILKSQLAATKRAILRINPENPKNLVYYFHDPLTTGWAVASSISIESERAEFLFNLLPTGKLGALQVWMRN